MAGRSGQARQIDIVIRGPMLGIADGLVAVDCKWHKRPTAVGVVESFAGLVDDIGADLGILVSNAGVTKGGKERAKSLRVRLRVLSREELDQWSPAGTRSVSFALSGDDLDLARRVLVNAGYRIRDRSGHWPDYECVLDAFRLMVEDDDVEEFNELVFQELEKADIQYRSIGSSVTIDGGTPFHRWINIHVPGYDIPFRVLAATEGDLQNEIDQLAATLGYPASVLRSEPALWMAFARYVRAGFKHIDGGPPQLRMSSCLAFAFGARRKRLSKIV
jgi:hypothetical protein